MHDFSSLLDRLSITYSNTKKMDLLMDFFKHTPDPERGYAIAVIAGILAFPTFKRGVVKELIYEQIDPYLFSLSYDYVGDIAETIALLWQKQTTELPKHIPALSAIIHQLKVVPRAEIKNYLRELFNQFNAIERWALIKLSTSELRIGVSARFIKQALAQYGNKDIHEIEQIWHGLQPPFIELFCWLENKCDKPDVTESLFFHPVMLAHPLDETDLNKIQPELFIAERKIDGIRIQFIHTHQGKALFSRTGENISHGFPEIHHLDLKSSIILDGELVIKKDNQLGSFNDLQQRLNRKIPSKKHLQDLPAHMVIYDILVLEHRDLRPLPFTERRNLLETWYKNTSSNHLSLSELLPFNSSEALMALRSSIITSQDAAVEGLMLKRKSSSYIAGRPTGQWYKWKKDPYLIDAVLMYAQRGHGKRSSYYSDYTFGLWQETELLPIGKAYFGFTDEELKQLDKWIRHHTVKRFGPVREVKKALVFEVAFEAVNLSSRHKSGFALRFPRVNRIRWDKPAQEADHIKNLKKYLPSSK